MKFVRKVKIDNLTLILSVASVVFAIFAHFYIMPHFVEFLRENNPERKKQLLFGFMLDVRFIIPTLLGALSALVLPIYFCIKNIHSFSKKWPLITITIIIFFFNLNPWLALFCLFWYMLKFWDEFQQFRGKNYKKPE